MRLLWKVATPVLCMAVIGGAATLWSVHKTKENERKLADAARACRLRAEQGDLKAEFDLAHMYYIGRGVPRNLAEAFRWCRKAADQGNAKAEYDLAHLYLEGEGVSRDYEEALSWYRKSADQGDSWGEYGVGFMYSHGYGEPQDYREAVRWFRKAADQGNAMAQNELGIMSYKGHGIPQDNAEAARWYRKAADQGYALGESGIGFMLWYGYGVPRDRTEANRWFRKAADQGDEYAIDALSAKLTTDRKAPLLIKLVVGIWLTFSFLSFNIFESGEGLRGFRQRVITGTGIYCLFTVWLSWYGYTHYKIRCSNCGINAFTLTKWILDAILLALLVYIVRTPKKTAKQQDEIAASETNVSGGNKEP
jgi:TPR repeat protein